MGIDGEDELAQRRRERQNASAEFREERRFGTLSEHVGTGRAVTIRTHVPLESVHGYLLALSPQLALLHAFNDFEPDGYLVISVGDIAEVVSGDREQFWERVVTGEGLLEGLKLDASIDLTSFATALASIAGRHPDLALLTADDELFVGRFLAQDDKELQLHAIDHLGNWDGAVSRIAFDQLARIQFGTPYLRLFMKYAPPAPPLESK
jgi:hypothetical protein